MTSTPCPEDHERQRLIEGVLDQEAKRMVKLHLRGCPAYVKPSGN